MKPRKLICLLLALAMLFSLAACGGSSSGSSSGAASGGESSTQSAENAEADAKDTLTLAVTSEPNHLNPKGIPEVVDTWILPNIMETLLTFDDDGNLVPMLAESYEYESDTVMLWHLRQGVKFHNGEEMTAEDVLFSLYLTSQAVIIDGNVADIDFDQSEVVDDYTLRLVFHQPTLAALYFFTWMTTSIVCKSAWEEMGEDAYAVAPIGTGPYKFVSWDANGTITLEAFGDYWDSDNAAHIPNLVFTVIEDANARAIALETGTVDFAYQISVADVPALEAAENVVVYEGPSEDVHTMMINGQNSQVEALHDPLVRRAMVMALDREALVDAIYDGRGSAAYSLLTPDTFGYNDSFGKEAYPYDPEGAKALLEEAGYGDGFSFKFMIMDDTTQITMAEACRSMWEQIGLDCQIDVLEMGSFMNLFDASEFDVMYNYITITTGDGDDILKMLFYSDFNNNFNDPKLDELIDAQHFELDEEARLQALYDLQEYATEVTYIVNLFNLDVIFGYRTGLDGFVEPRMLMYRDMAGVYFTD